MTSGHFIWADLSTYDAGTARADYTKLFDWSFSGDPNYDFALLSGEPVAAVFPMPERLREIQMPSFWMSYVRVDDLDATVEKARSHPNVIIEVEPQAFDEASRIALVRDPSGAGFMMYEGLDITPKATGAGLVTTRYHHVPDVALIQDFYADLFGWSFIKTGTDPWPVYDVHHPDGTVIAQVEEVPEEIRGKYRYWIPCFEVASAIQAVDVLVASGGAELHPLTQGRRFVADQQGAHFLLQGEDDYEATTHSKDVSSNSKLPWKAVLGLIFVWLAVYFEVDLFWGVLFLIWTWPAIRSGRADFGDPVIRSRNPLIYWALIATWVGLSLWLISLSLPTF